MNTIKITSLAIEAESKNEAMKKLYEILNTRLQDFDLSELGVDDKYKFFENYQRKEFAICIPSFKCNIDNLADLLPSVIKLGCAEWFKIVDNNSDVIFILNSVDEQMSPSTLQEKFKDIDLYIKSIDSQQFFKNTKHGNLTMSVDNLKLVPKEDITATEAYDEIARIMFAPASEGITPTHFETLNLGGVTSFDFQKTSNVPENQIHQTTLESETEYRSITVLAKVKRMANNKSHLELFSNLLGSDIRNCTVDTDKLDQASVKFDGDSLIEKVNFENYHQMLLRTQQSLPYMQAQHVLWFCKFGMARKSWIDKNTHFVVYSEFSEGMSEKDLLDPNVNMILQWGNRQNSSNLSIGWTPTKEDQAATDWIIVS